MRVREMGKEYNIYERDQIDTEENAAQENERTENVR